MKPRLVTVVRAFSYKAWVAESVVLLAVDMLCYAHSFWRRFGVEYSPHTTTPSG